MTNNSFDSEQEGSFYFVNINDIEYHCEKDTAAIVHALMCIDATIEDGLNKISDSIENLTTAYEIRN